MTDVIVKNSRFISHYPVDITKTPSMLNRYVCIWTRSGTT